MILIELAVESLAGAQAAAAGGADRIELAPELAAGGVTPSDDLTRSVIDQVDVPIFAMVRPRAGDFIYTSRELADMCVTIEKLRAVGVRGLVTGALTNSQTIDLAAAAALVAAASGLPVTFHRAFDRATDLSTALEPCNPGPGGHSRPGAGSPALTGGSGSSGTMSIFSVLLRRKGRRPKRRVRPMIGTEETTWHTRSAPC